MSFELALRKAGMPLVRSFIHAVQGVTPAMPSQVKKSMSISYKFKAYKDGKVFNVTQIESIQDAFPITGDKK